MTQTVKSRVAELARQGYTAGSIVGIINSQRTDDARQTTMASVKVMLSQLRRDGVCVPQLPVTIEVSLAKALDGAVAFEAAARGLSRAGLIEQVISTIVCDDLWNAVLDDEGGGVMARPVERRFVIWAILFCGWMIAAGTICILRGAF